MPDTIEQQWIERAERELAQARESELQAKAAELKKGHEQRQREAKEHAEREANRARVVSLAAERAGVLADAEATAVARLDEALDAIETVVRERRALAGLARELGATSDDVRDLQQADPLVEWVIGSLAQRFQRETGRLAGHEIRHAAASPRSLGAVKAVFQRLGVDTEEFKSVAATRGRSELVAARAFTYSGKQFQAGDVVDGIDEDRVGLLARTGYIVERPRSGNFEKKAKKR